MSHLCVWCFLAVYPVSYLFRGASEQVLCYVDSICERFLWGFYLSPSSDSIFEPQTYMAFLPISLIGSIFGHQTQ